MEYSNVRGILSLRNGVCADSERGLVLVCIWILGRCEVGGNIPKYTAS